MCHFVVLCLLVCPLFCFGCSFILWLRPYRSLTLHPQSYLFHTPLPMSKGAAELPPRLKGLRACLRCRLIKSSQQFMDEGCENCNEELGDDATAVENFTTPVFKGMIAMMEPKSSWIARWHRQENKARGMYAMKVYGQQKQGNQQNEEEEEY